MARREATLVMRTPEQIAAVGSPARGEIISALGDLGSATAAELAARLGRARTALYHHLAVLQRAGVLETSERRGGRRPETVYALAAPRILIGPELGSQVARTAARKAAESVLRTSARELGRALEDEGLAAEGRRDGLWAIRSKARLRRDERRRIQRHVREIENILRDAKRRTGGPERMYAFTAALTPTPEKS